MYAIVEIAGKQYKLEPDTQVMTDRLQGKVGDTVEFDRVLLLADGDKVQVGTPTVPGGKVQATIEGEVRGEKVIVFKKKRRKGYRKKTGHRQYYTVLKVKSIKAGKSAKKAQEQSNQNG
ncbi:MAG: 50S ribosomal protein L21 [Calditrichaeota bacterium]|nr:MAG: 50S ribosomal protein L21 [Calditrichota bacterium]